MVAACFTSIGYKSYATLWELYWFSRYIQLSVKKFQTSAVTVSLMLPLRLLRVAVPVLMPFRTSVALMI